MRETRNPGDTIEAGNLTTGFRYERYAMEGDTYMTSTRVGELADVLHAHAISVWHLDWLPQIADRLGLVTYDYPGETVGSKAALILAKAHVTWADICSMKS